jgi:hypothetical protein
MPVQTRCRVDVGRNFTSGEGIVMAAGNGTKVEITFGPVEGMTDTRARCGLFRGCLFKRRQLPEASKYQSLLTLFKPTISSLALRCVPKSGPAVTGAGS